MNTQTCQGCGGEFRRLWANGLCDECAQERPETEDISAERDVCNCCGADLSREGHRPDCEELDDELPTWGEGDDGLGFDPYAGQVLDDDPMDPWEDCWDED